MVSQTYSVNFLFVINFCRTELGHESVPGWFTHWYRAEKASTPQWRGLDATTGPAMVCAENVVVGLDAVDAAEKLLHRLPRI